MGMSGGVNSNVTLIVGLGNPGIEYQFTPHNVGFLAIDRLAEHCGVVVNNRRSKALTAAAQIAGRRVLLVKPETFMNLSGLSVGSLVKELELNPQRDVIALYDDVALPLGSIRVRERGSSGGHNGVKSITGALGTPEWLRVRIGVAPGSEPAAEAARQGRRNYVLTPFRKTELAVLDTALEQVAVAVKVILAEGAGAAMNRFNRRIGGEEE
ncbi:MAG TPA: aminoacyl-tRNA hydrolase [Acidobacteriaceae bacterium]|nr:aminoacyl-tRNA hydrolase [Acidobacteriaceae bacterium]